MEIFALETVRYGIEPYCYASRKDAVSARSELQKLAAYRDQPILVKVLICQLPLKSK